MEKRDMETEGAIPEATNLLPEPERAEEVKEVDGNVEGSVPVTELSLESLQVQIDRLNGIVAQLTARAGTPRVRTQAEVDGLVKEANAEAKLTADQKTEREIRRYVKRDGGYRKGITKAQRALAGRLLKKLGRDGGNPTWDIALLR